MISNTSGDFLLNPEILAAGDFGRGDEASRVRIDDGDDKRPPPLCSGWGSEVEDACAIPSLWFHIKSVALIYRSIKKEIRQKEIRPNAME
jgi:hypothetical protein